MSAIRCILLDFLKVLYFVFPDWLCLRDCCLNSHVGLCVLFFNKQIIIIIIIIIQLKIIVIVIAKTIRYAYAYKNEFCPWELYSVGNKLCDKLVLLTGVLRFDSFCI